MPNEIHIATQTHGRYLLESGNANNILLVGFHGYSENAEIQMTRLQQIGDPSWHRCSVQGLHQFYRQNRIAASWMTSQDRELAISNNLAYIDNVLDQLRQHIQWNKLIIAGFSQGAAMAYRTAALGAHQPDLVLINGGDIPPELSPQQLRSLSPCLVIAGDQDQAYDSDQMLADQKRVQDFQQFSFSTFSGPHSWPSAASALCYEFIKQHHL